MFELESALRDWTARLNASDAMRRTDIEELDQHIRDSMIALKTSGLSDEEAFLVATHRVGPSSHLQREFHKVNGGYIWRQRLFWMLAGFLALSIGELVISAMGSLSQAVIAMVGGDGTIMAFTSIGVTAASWCLFVLCLYLCVGVPTQRSSRGTEASRLSGLSIGLGAILAIAFATLIKFGGQIAITALAPLDELRQSMMISAWANQAFTLLIPVGALCVMLIIRASLRERVAVEE